MSWVLGIDTSSIDLGVALFQDNLPVASYSRFVRNSHAEHISQIVKMILSANSVEPQQVQHVAVSTGPGSFTGLRIGIAFAKGFCFGRDALICPVSSLMILAHAGIMHRGKIVAAIDARNDEVFCASFISSDRNLQRTSEDLLCSSDQFRHLAASADIIITDSMGYSRSTVFNFLEGNQGWFPVERFPFQRGFFCASTGASLIQDFSAWKQGTEILPNYLRQSSAQYKAGKMV